MIKIYGQEISEYSGKYYFSWKLSGDCGQTGYRIRVRNRCKEIVWDSGNVFENVRHNIECAAELERGERFTWELVCRGADGSEDTANGDAFVTSVPGWSAKWIEPDRRRKPLNDCKDPHAQTEETEPLERLDPPVCFRKRFRLAQLPEYAPLYVSAHGVYAMWVNGIRVSDILAPGYTSYHKRLEYQCYDVTPHLVCGENVILAVVADGWYTGKIGAVGAGQQYGNESALIFQMEHCRNGIRHICCESDETTEWTYGPWKYADLFVGEYYDAGAETDGWETGAGFQDQTWRRTVEKDYGYGNLTLQSIPPVRETECIVPEMIKTPGGELLLDAGATVVGYVSFELEMEPGEKVVLEHSETLDKEGNFLQNIIGHNKDQTDVYVAAKSGIQKWKPLFTYHGFRYVRLSGTDRCRRGRYKIYVVETPLEQTGVFTCSDKRLDRLQENILRSQRGNMVSIPTDCPQREKTGWTGDVQVYAPTACYEQNVEKFLRHWLEDMRNEQLPDGQIPHIVPYIPSHDYMKPPGIEGVSSAGWSDAAVIVPWRLYEAYGDKRILEENFAMMQRYMASVEMLASEIPEDKKNEPEEVKERQRYLWNTGFQYGDWLMPSVKMSSGSIFEVVKETGYIVATLLYALTTRIMEQACRVLGEEEESRRYSLLNEKIRSAFAEEYITDDGKLQKDYQGVYVLALATDAVPEEYRDRMLGRLEELIRQNGNRLDTGFLSVPYLLPTLASNGKRELANKILFCEECPSWLYEVKMGATTMWEYWDGYAPDGTPDECSMNHFAFGCAGEYLFRSVLGIEAVEPGFKRIRIRPDVLCGLEEVKGSFDSIWGKIEVKWEQKGNRAVLYAAIPPDVTAEIVLGDKRTETGCGEVRMETKIK